MYQEANLQILPRRGKTNCRSVVVANIHWRSSLGRGEAPEMTLRLDNPVSGGICLMWLLWNSGVSWKLAISKGSLEWQTALEFGLFSSGGSSSLSRTSQPRRAASHACVPKQFACSLRVSGWAIRILSSKYWGSVFAWLIDASVCGGASTERGRCCGNLHTVVANFSSPWWSNFQGIWRLGARLVFGFFSFSFFFSPSSFFSFSTFRARQSKISTPASNHI